MVGISRSRTRTEASWRFRTASSTTTRRFAANSAIVVTASGVAATPKSSPTSTRRWATSYQRASREVRSCRLGRHVQAGPRRARSSRRQADLLRGRRRPRRLRVRVEGVLASGLVDPSLDLRRDRRLPDASASFRPADAAGPGAQAASWTPARHRRRCSRGAVLALPVARPGPRMTEEAHAEQLLDAPRGGRAPAPDERRPSRCDAQRRPRLEPASSRSWPGNMAEPVKTFSVGFVEDGARNELGDARARRTSARNRAPRAPALDARRRRSSSRISSGRSTSRSRTCRRSASWRCASSLPGT